MRRFELIKQMNLGQMADYLEKELAAMLRDVDLGEWLSELIEEDEA